MTTTDLSRPQLGVVEASAFARTLTLLGYGITGGGEFRQAAGDIRLHPNSSTLTVVAADVPRAGLRAWLTKQAATGARVVVLRAGEASLPDDIGVVVALPASVNQIMAAAGWGASPHPLGDAMVDISFGVAGLAAFEPAPVVELAPAPVAPAPVVELAPAPPAPVELAPAPVVQASAPAALPALPDWASALSLPGVVAAPDVAVSSPAAMPAAEFVPASVDADDEDDSVWPTLSAPVSSRDHVSFASDVPAMVVTDSDVDADVPAELPVAAVDVPAALPDWASELASPAPVVVPVPAPAPIPVEPELIDFDSMVAAAQLQHNAEVIAEVPRRGRRAAETPPDFVAGEAVAEPVAQPAVALPEPVQHVALPVFEQPAVEPLAVAQPVAEPVFEAPMYEAPVFEQPVFEAPVFEAPVYEAPVYEAPVFEQPAAPALDPTNPAFWNQAPEVFQAPAPAFELPPVFEPAVAEVFAVDARSERMSEVAESWAPGQSALVSLPESDRARVIVCFAGKGGVGKTSSALLIAQRAAESGMRVALIDMNRGQGDIRSYLRLDSQSLSTIYNAALTGNPADAVLDPDQVNAARHSSLPKLGFAVVLAPPADFADPTVVTAEVYGQVLGLLQQKADLVVVDTQITEARDTSGLIDRVVVPAMNLGAFGFGVTDLSKPGMENLLSRTRDFTTRGVARDRLLLAVNKVSGFSAADRKVVESRFTDLAHFVGAIGEDSKLAESLNSGHVDTSIKSVRPILDLVLLRVTGREVFNPTARKRGFFGGRR